MPLTLYRRNQYDLIPKLLSVIVNYLIDNGIPIDIKSIRAQIEDSPLSKEYRYSNSHHSTSLINISYDTIIGSNGVERLSKRISLIDTHIPKLQEDNISFVLKGSRYIPMIYLTDYPISVKKNSISFESLFMTFIMNIEKNAVTILDTRISLEDFLRIFFDDVEVETLLDVSIKSKKKEALNRVRTSLRFTTPTTNLETKLNQMFFDSWTSNNYSKLYNLNNPSLKDILLIAINQYNSGERYNFVDLKYKRLQFIEILMKPIFKAVTDTVRKYNSGYNRGIYTILNNNSSIVKWFTGELENSTLYESANNFASLTLFKASYKSPNSGKLPESVSSIHSTYEGVICPVTVSNNNSGQKVTFTPYTIIDSIGRIKIKETRMQHNNPVTSTGLSSVGFISSTDATRLQMAAKQLAQALVSPNCDIPYVVGNRHRDVAMNEGRAKDDGIVVYKDERILVVEYLNLNVLDVIPIPEFRKTKDKFHIQLLWSLETNTSFKKYDLLYEYSSTKNGIVAYGYNLKTAFMPLMGLTCEDAVIISESAARKMKRHESETIHIPIFPFTKLYKLNQHSKYGFIANEGEEIDSDEVLKITVLGSNVDAQVNAIKDKLHPNQYKIRKSPDKTDITIRTKLHHPVLKELRVHTHADKWAINDRESDIMLSKLCSDKLAWLMDKAKTMQNTFGKKYTASLLFQHHAWKDAKRHLLKGIGDYNLQGVIELTLLSESSLTVGDKVANRVAGKGTVSTILPDELMPRVNGEPLEYITNPMGVFNRINYAQLNEVVISKVIERCEKLILDDINNIKPVLTKLSELSVLLKDAEYAQKILKLRDTCNLEDFQTSVRLCGLFFEVKCFVSLDMPTILKYIQDELHITINEDVIIPKQLYKYISHHYDINVDSDWDVIANNVFVGPMYIIMLQHMVSHKLNARDFGAYMQGSNNPSSKSGTGNKASKVGNMELDALLGHGCISVVKELRSVKSTAIDLKSDLISQILSNGVYNLPELTENDRILSTINSLINAANSKTH